MNKLTQEAPQSFRGRMYQREGSKPKEQKILVLRTGIAGLRHHIKTEEQKAIIDSITPGTELLLFREPDNEYDVWAIAVHLPKDNKIGFVSRYKNETIARLMDAGKKFVAIVDSPEDDTEDTAEKKQRMYNHAYTENMEIAFSIYLIEEA